MPLRGWGWREAGSAMADLWQGSPSFISEPIPRGWACLSLLGTIVRLQIIETKSKCISQVGELVLRKPLFFVHLFPLPDRRHCSPRVQECFPVTASLGFTQTFGGITFWLGGFITLRFSKWQIHVAPLPWKKAIRENSSQLRRSSLFSLHPQT